MLPAEIFTQHAKHLLVLLSPFPVLYQYYHPFHILGPSYYGNP